MNTELIREALTEAKEAMMWELGGEPIWSLTAAARLKIEEALAALDEINSDTKTPIFLCQEPVAHWNGVTSWPAFKLASTHFGDNFSAWKPLYTRPPVTAPCLDREEATLLMELMQAALNGEKLALLRRLSEQQLYNKLAVLAGNKEQL